MSGVATPVLRPALPTVGVELMPRDPVPPPSQSQTVGVELMPRLVRRFLERHPGVEVQLAVESTRKIALAVASGEGVGACGVDVQDRTGRGIG